MIIYTFVINKIRMLKYISKIFSSLSKSSRSHFTKKMCIRDSLYPDDSDRNGELLRIYQQYFMVSNAAQLIIDEARAKGSNIHDLYEYAYVQINDTHPSMVIPELIRLMTENYGIEFEEAYSIVQKMTGYTNHTILAEALEKWPLEFLEVVVPHLVTDVYKRQR